MQHDKTCHMSDATGHQSGAKLLNLAVAVLVMAYTLCLLRSDLKAI